MSQQGPQDRFDLARFVLGFLEREGSIISPPAYGVHEVLIPDALAARLGVDSYLRLSFDVEASDALRLSVNHPLVEAIAEQLMQEMGYAQVYIDHVRLEKKGLYDVAAQAFSFPNARLAARRAAVPQAAFHHYLRFNFKVAFLSDEKQEQIVSVLLDVQGGYPVRDPDLLERLISSETRSTLPDLAVAKPRWQGAGDALDSATYLALLPRAQAAAEAEVAGRLGGLQARMQRFLEQDLARIEDYYDSLEKDLQQRRARSDAGEEERRSSLEDKVQALREERAAKLADIRARYQLRVELELINVLRIVQPKLALPVEIANRRVTIIRFAVWDPLVHRLEALVCDVCGEPGEGLHLCTGGHLAHSHCLAPQCIECNREYCQLCADQVQECVVCHRPVCRTSLRLCPGCGRGTCAEHQGLCHAADGQPLALQEVAAPAPAPEPAPPPPPPPKPEIKAAPKPPAREPTKKPAAPKPASAVKAVRLNVEISQDLPHIAAFVMRSTNRVLATRTIELTPEGILIHCNCEKDPCPADGWLFRPAGPEQIQEQIKEFLSQLRQEYYLPPKRVTYYTMRYPQPRESQVLMLPPIWRDEQLLADARKGFDGRRRIR